MPLRETNIDMVPNSIDVQEPAPVSFLDSIAPAFRQYNDVTNLAQMFTAPDFERDDTFHLKTHAEKTGNHEIVAQRSNAFIGVHSAEAFDYKISKIHQEEADRNALNMAGGSGFVTSIMAGILSPTIAIPLIGSTAKGLQAVKQGALLGTAAGALQTLPLALNQETREASENLIDIAAGTVVGGFLGGLVGTMRKAEVDNIIASFEAGDTVSTDVANLHPIKGAPVGSQSVEAPDPGKLKGFRGGKVQVDFISKVGGFVTRSPVVHAIMNKYTPSARSAMWKLSNAGLRAEGNVNFKASGLGGTVENRIKVWSANLYAGQRAIDKSYIDYIYQGQEKPALAGARAALTGLTSSAQVSKKEFKDQVAQAIYMGDEFQGVSEAKKAADEIIKEIYTPMTEAAQKVGLLPEDLPELIGDPRYLNRVFDNDKIKLNEPAFIELLTENHMQRMEESFQKRLENLKGVESKEQELVEAIQLDTETVAKQREQFLEELEGLKNQPEEIYYEQLAALRAEKKAAPKTVKSEYVNGQLVPATQKTKKQVQEEIDSFLEGQGENFTDFQAKKATTNRRLRNLNQAAVVHAEKFAKKFERIERLEEQQQRSLEILVRKGKALEKNIDRFSEEKLAGEISKLKTAFSKHSKIYDKQTERLKTLREGEDAGGFNKVFDVSEAQGKKQLQLNRIAEKLDDVDTIMESREVLEDILRGFFQEALERTNTLNSRRAVRMHKLAEQSKKFDLKGRVKKIAEISAKAVARREKFVERYRSMGEDNFGVDGVDIDLGTANFSNYSRGMAIATKDRILNTHGRLPGIDIMQGKRGAELLRTLDIPTDKLKDFIITDVEDLIKIYVRTMAPDIEMQKAFGSVNADQVFKDMAQEQLFAKEAAKNKAEINAISDEFKITYDSVLGVIERLRHMRGVPNNPGGAAHRLAKIAQNLNVLRFMGTVVPSSLPDIARPVFRYGLGTVFRDSMTAFTGDLKVLKMSAREAQLAGEANDMLSHSTSRHLMEVFDDVGRNYSHTLPGKAAIKIERGLEFATAKMGLIAGFDAWNEGLKKYASVMANLEFTRAMETVVEGGTTKELKRATEMLASVGYDAERVQKTWALITSNEGGGKINNVWMPNTENWTDPKVYTSAGMDLTEAQELVHGYRAALAGDINSTIITPGAERPLWMDGKSLTGRLIGQFRSFTFSSAQKTMMAGLQQGDMAVVNGTMFSLAMGMVSYYIWAIARGGKAEKEMNSASMEKWITEAVDRSGLLATLAEVKRLGEAVPVVRDNVPFIGTPSTRRAGGDVLESVLGPTVDLLDKIAKLAVEANDPTTSTVHTVRQLTAYQNVFYLKQIFDMIEEAAGAAFNIPERRN